MKLYSEKNLSDLIRQNHQTIVHKIKSETEDFILNAGEDQYINYLKDQFLLDAPIMKIENKFVDSCEREIPAQFFPRDLHITHMNRTFPRDVYIYSVPFDGNINLLSYRPSTYDSSIGYEVNIDQIHNAIKIEVIDFYNKSEKITKAFQTKLEQVLSCYKYLIIDIEKYNQNLLVFIKDELMKGKNKLLKTKQMLSSLGVPIKEKQEPLQHFLFQILN